MYLKVIKQNLKMKNWISVAIKWLDKSIKPIPNELNEIDWKAGLSNNNDKLCKHISAFANLAGGGFIVFGINDKTGGVEGINEFEAKEIIEKLSSLSRDGVEPLVSIDHSIEKFEHKIILIIYIKESESKPVYLKGKTLEETFIRSGGTTRKASRQELASLILNSKSLTWEELCVPPLLNEAEIVTQIEYQKIFQMTGTPTPSSIPEILRWLEQEKMIKEMDGKGYYITNFGAIAAAKDLNRFSPIARKSIRVIKYKSKNKSGDSKEYNFELGYAIGFEGLLQFVKGLLPGSEVIKNVIREDVSVYPEIALRELIANVLIHQDFSIRGSGPMVEIFEDRIEFSNPGKLLPSKKLDRLIRTSPESRNEILASAFRRYKICEERGSGFEKTVIAIELFGLPPLKFEESENSFKVTMFSPRKYAEMSNEERIEACYQHSIIMYFGQGGFNNTSLRKRFGMHDKQVAQISKLIKDSIEAGKIKAKTSSNESKKFSIYVPYWA
jgi:ATP-dependent DNA helicase RecG